MVDKAGAVSVIGGDPRRPSDVVKYRRPATNPDSAGMDGYGFVAVVLGIVGIMFKIPWFSFASLAFTGSAFLQGNQETDVKSLMMSVMFALMGLFNTYFVPPHVATNSTAAAAAKAATQAAGAPIPGM